MNFKLSVILLHLFATTTLSSSHVNDSSYRSQLHRLPSMSTTATISADSSCNASHCNRSAQNESESTGSVEYHEVTQSTKAAAGNNGTVEVMARLFSQQHVHSDRLAGSSIIYGLLSVAALKGERGQCFSELNQIYEGIQRKEIWAMKGMHIELLQMA